jgi:hypothetical protein
MNIIIIILFFLTTVKNEMVFEEIKVCTEGSRIDFMKSCKSKEEICIKELEYIKNFQDFTNMFFTLNKQTYHAIDDSIYVQNCEITNQVIFKIINLFPYSK